MKYILTILLFIFSLGQAQFMFSKKSSAPTTVPIEVPVIADIEQDGDSLTVTCSNFDSRMDSCKLYVTYTIPNAVPVEVGILDTTSTDSITSIKFAHGIWTFRKVTAIIYVHVDDDSQYGSAISYIYDVWPPSPGMVSDISFIPNYNAKFSMTESDSDDVYTQQLWIGAHSPKDSTDILAVTYSSGNVTGASVSLLASGLPRLSFVGQDTLAVKGKWLDSWDNESDWYTVKVAPTGSPNQYLLKLDYDSSWAVVKYIRVLIGSTDAASSANGDMIIDIADTLMRGDTVMVDIPDTLITQHTSGGDTAFIWTQIYFTSNLWSPDTSGMVSYPARTAPTNDIWSPNITGTIALSLVETDSFRITPTSVSSDSADVNHYLFVIKEADGDSIQYVQDSPTTHTLCFTNNPPNFSWGDENAAAYCVAVDDSGNISSQITSTLSQNWDYIKAKLDTTTSALTSVRVFRNTSDSTLAGSDSGYVVGVEDIDLTLGGDTALVALAEDWQNAFFNLRPLFNTGKWGAVGNWKEWPESAPPAGSYNLLWTGDNASGTLIADTTDAGTITGTLVNGGTISSDYNHTSGGTYSFYCNGGGKYIRFANNPGSSEGRLSMWVYRNNAIQADGLFEFNDGAVDGSNVIRAHVETDGTIYFRHEGNDNVVTIEATTATVPLTTWILVCFRWSATNNKISVKIGDNSWEDDTDADVVTAFTSEKPNLSMGEDVASTKSGDHYIDDVTYYRTYNESWSGD